MNLDPNEDQIGQSIFAQICCPNPGVVVDIGCNSPDFFSNSKPLLEIGWRMFGIDLEPGDWSAYARAKAEAVDAAKAYWGLVHHCDYLSVDVDEQSMVALSRFAATYNGRPPVCATIEHEQYRLGPAMMQMQNKLMGELGYVLVGNNLWNYENWFVHESHPKVGELAIAFSPWGDEDNNDVERIPVFKQYLKELKEGLA